MYEYVDESPPEPNRRQTRYISFLVTLIVMMGTFLGVGSYFGSETDWQTQVSQTVAISLDGGEHINGSGTFISENVILTAEHVTRGHEVVTVRDSEGNESRGLVYAEDAVRDLSLVIVPELSHGSPVRLANAPPEVGDSITHVGHWYGDAVPWGISSGLVSATSDQHERVLHRGTITGAPGSSGGPIFNADGELVGVLVQGLRHMDEVIYYVRLGSIQRFLAEQE